MPFRGTGLFTCSSVTVYHTNTFEGEVPPAHPSLCTGPRGKDLSASRHHHTRDLPHPALWAAAETSMGDGCWCNTVCVWEKREALLLLCCPCTVLRRLEDHTCKGNCWFRGRSSQMSHPFFSTGTLLLPATWIKYIKRLCLSSIANRYECFMGEVKLWAITVGHWTHTPLFFINTSPTVSDRQPAGSACWNQRHQSQRFCPCCTEAYSLNTPGCHTEFSCQTREAIFMFC